MAKTYREQLRDIARDYARTVERQYSLDDLVKWAIDTGAWQLSAQDAFRIGRTHFRQALQKAKDDNDVRIFIDAKMEQTHLWADRRDASWQLRQAFLNEQADRVVKYRAAVIAMYETLNGERKRSEPEFQLVFNWDDEEGQVA